MTATAAWCAVKDMLAEAPELDLRGAEGGRASQLRERVEFLEEKLREQVERNLELQAEVEAWKGGDDEEWDSPEELHGKMQELSNEVERLEAERDEAQNERDSARYVVESIGHYLSKCDVDGAMVVAQEDIASRPYREGSQQQDTLKRLAPLVDSLTKSKVWVRANPRNTKPKGKP